MGNLQGTTITVGTAITTYLKVRFPMMIDFWFFRAIRVGRSKLTSGGANQILRSFRLLSRPQYEFWIFRSKCEVRDGNFPRLRSSNALSTTRSSTFSYRKEETWPSNLYVDSTVITSLLTANWSTSLFRVEFDLREETGTVIVLNPAAWRTRAVQACRSRGTTETFRIIFGRFPR